MISENQREGVRKLLTTFGEDHTIQDDLFMGAVSGTSVEWHHLTPGTKKYPFVREVCAQFEPYVRSKRLITNAKFEIACKLLGLKMHNISDSMISSAVEQADPITLIQIQMQKKDNGIIIERIRFII